MNSLNKPMVKAFGYARKSPDEKEDTETSINNQIFLFKNVSKEKGFELVKIFVDKNVSGSDRQRKEFLKMIDEIKHSDVGVILVKDQDRFARDSAFFYDTLQDLEIRDKKVYSIMKNKFLSYEDLGDVITSVVDAYYITTQRKKTELLFNQKKELGLPPISAPFGYKNKNKKWVISKVQSEKVKVVIDDYKNNVSYKITTQRLRISPIQYYRILKNYHNGIYSGYVYYIKKIKDANKNIVRTEEVKYRGNHTPII